MQTESKALALAVAELDRIRTNPAKPRWRKIKAALKAGKAALTVEHAEAVKAVKIGYDEHNGDTPWDNDDFYSHKLEKTDFEDEANNAVGAFYSNDYRGPRVIRIDGKQFTELAAYYHSAGHSKQVAAELAAEQRRKTLKQLKTWYLCGWSWYYVRAELKGCQSSCYGFLSEDEAKQAAPEILAELIAELENVGYTINSKPS